MPANASELIATALDWTNLNQGIVSIAIFAITLLIGWISGIFSALRRKPKFKLDLLDGPTFCCTFLIGTRFNEHDVHRTGFALYLTIANVGSAPASIQDIHIAYHWHLRPWSLNWIKYRLGWFWLKNQAVALSDFQVSIGDKKKIYPFLIQANNLSPNIPNTYIQVGQSERGVVYFEQEDSWGGCFPTIHNQTVPIKVKVIDVFGASHTAKFAIPVVSMEYARKYNPSFGMTFAELRNQPLPNDDDLIHPLDGLSMPSSKV
jgi:hypothetical protein